MLLELCDWSYDIVGVVVVLCPCCYEVGVVRVGSCDGVYVIVCMFVGL